MRIGEVARAAQVTTQAVRLYERRGLLKPAARSASGYRVYDPTAVKVLRSIKRAQELGFSLKEIKEMRDLHQRPSDLPKAREVVEQKLSQVGERIEWLQEMQEELRKTLRRTKQGDLSRCLAAPREPGPKERKRRKSP